MIYYLVSFPRAGNSWVRRVLMHKFGIFPTSIYPTAWPKMAEANPEWKIRRSPEVWNGVEIPFLGKFTSPFSSGNQAGYLIIPDAEDQLSNQYREQLAASNEPFFVKTHRYPFENHFDGERFILIERHPGASLWSYYHFLKARSKESPSLEDVICGRTPQGCWSSFYSAWEEMKSRHSADFLRIKYEELSSNCDQVVSALGAFIGRDSLGQEMPTFLELNEKNPMMFRAGSVDQWSEYFTVEEKALLSVQHRKAASFVGYSV